MQNIPIFDSNPSLLDDNEQKFFSEFLDGLMEYGSNDQRALNGSVQLEDPRLQTNQSKGYAALGLTNQSIPKKRGPGRPRKEEKNVDELVEDEDKTKRPAKRDLLTEVEKRKNHVASEQKRRKLIRDGFQVLVDLTPSLANSPPTSNGPGNTGGGHSKSTVLFKAADYIKELKQQVAVLQQQLQSATAGLALQKTAETKFDMTNSLRSAEQLQYNYNPNVARNQPEFIPAFPNGYMHPTGFPTPPSFLSNSEFLDYSKKLAQGQLQQSFLVGKGGQKPERNGETTVPGVA